MRKAILAAILILAAFVTSHTAHVRQVYRGQPAHLIVKIHWLIPQAPAQLYYVVRPGNTLSRIAATFYGEASLWPALWWVNKGQVHDPNLIFPGQRLKLSRWHPEEAWLLRAALEHTTQPTRWVGRITPVHSSPRFTVRYGAAGGTLSFYGLERLWVSAGGAVWAEATAACIAEHESGGRQYATGAVGERGYWQINPVNGPVLSTYDPYGNARAAVIMSHDGTNWSAWTTAPMCGM